MLRRFSKCLTVVSSLLCLGLAGCVHAGSGPFLLKTLEPPVLNAGAVAIDGVLDEAAWKVAVTRSDFTYPWQNEIAPDTVFESFVHADHFYFAFTVTDSDVVIAEPWEGEATVPKEDRVEFFFAGSAKLTEYYCVEIDPLGRVLDYRAAYYRKFDDTWNCPGLEAAATRTDTGYIVEGRMPLDVFAQVADGEITPAKPLLFGLYRAEFSHGEQGAVEEAWISWQQPDSKTPDFHIWSSFGRLMLPK